MKSGRTLLALSLLCAVSMCAAPARGADSSPSRGGEALRAASPEVQMLRALERASASSPFLRFLFFSFVLLVPVGVAIDVAFLRRLILRRGCEGRRRASVAWGLREVVAVIAVFFVALFSFRALYPLARRLLAGASGVSLSILLQFLAEIIALFCLFAFMKRNVSSALEELGVSGGGLWGNISLGIRGYIGYLPVMIALIMLTQELADRAGIELAPQEQIGLFFMRLSAPSLVFLVLFVAVLGPVIEEIFFRGFAYQALRNRWRRWPSIILTALLFSALHNSLSVFLPILGLGVLLAYVFEVSGSLVPSIIIHVCQNSVAVAGALLIRLYS